MGILTAMLLNGCGKDTKKEAAEMRQITDSMDRTVEVPKEVERIVCVGVSALRYTCYMEGEDLVVGVEDYETKESLDRLYNYVNYDQFKDLSIIGGNGEPYGESIIAADPQVIVMSASASADPEDLEAKTGIPVVVIAGSDTTLDDSAFETIDILGTLYGKEQRAEELTCYLREVEEDLDARTSQIKETEKPSVYVGGISFKGVHGFEGTESGYGPFALIHANNLADTTGQRGAFNIDTEQVLTWDPDIIFVDYNGLALIREDYQKNPSYYEHLTAVQEGRVYAQISFRSYASNLETALADAYYAGTVIYPEAFSDVDLEEKVREIFQELLGADPYEDLKEAGYEFTQIHLGS